MQADTGFKHQLIIDLWENCSSSREAAEALDISVTTLKWEIWALRRRGYELKRYPGIGRDLSAYQRRSSTPECCRAASGRVDSSTGILGLV